MKAINITVIIFITVITTIFASPTHAQETASPAADFSSPQPLAQATPLPMSTNGLSLVVSPPIIDLRTEPGASKSAKIKLKNNGNAAEALEIRLMKFVPDRSGGRPQLSELNANDIFPQWLNFSETKFTMDTKSWKTIDFTFSPPENAAPAYYFAIVFDRQNVEKVPGSAALNGAAAVLVLVQVSSARVYHQIDLQQLTSTGFDFKTKYIYEFLPVNFTITLQNSGNVHEKAYGNIYIDWLTGRQKEVAVLDVNADGSFILPQTTRSFETSWKDGFPVWEEVKDANGDTLKDKNGEPKRKLKWDLSKILMFRIGKYRAQLLMVYNDGIRDIPLEAETSFWVIPWRILLALLVLLIIILFGLKGVTQQIWHKFKETQERLKFRSMLNKRFKSPPTHHKKD